MSDFTVKHSKEKERAAIAEQLKAVNNRLDNLLSASHGDTKIQLTDAKYYGVMMLAILKEFK